MNGLGTMICSGQNREREGGDRERLPIIKGSDAQTRKGKEQPANGRDNRDSRCMRICKTAAELESCGRCIKGVQFHVD